MRRERSEREDRNKKKIQRGKIDREGMKRNKKENKHRDRGVREREREGERKR